jgi:Cd2+/Zn2+-exporting ATPase
MDCFTCDRFGGIVDIAPHRHGPGCGHPQVAHDDHYDYVGDDGMLHHLLEADCCEYHSSAAATDHHSGSGGGAPVIVNHGRFSLLHRRKATSASSSITSSPEKRFVGRATTPTKTAAVLCMGSNCTLACCVGGASLDNVNPSEAIITKIYCEGVCCPMEIPVVESALHRIPGVISVEVAVVTKTVTTKHVPSLASPAALVAALQEARLGASLTFPRQQNVGKRSWLPPWYVSVSIVLLIISLFHYLSGPLNAPWLENFKWIALGAVALCLPRIALKAFGALRHYVLDIHFLITLAAAGAIAIGDYTEASIVVVLFCIADFLEERCTGQARDAISAVLALKPDNAVLAATGEEVSAMDVAPGTLILIRAGDKAPLDGIVVTGTSAFDESILTGESVAVVKHPGDTVCAGTLNAGSGLVQVKTTATSDETFIAGMARLVEQATSRQSPAEAAVAKFARIYTPLVLVACLLLAFVPWSDPDADRKWWVYLSLQVLVTACPCALVLSTPVTIVSALARAAQVGVLIKGGIVLETLQDVKVVTFDKTGTLTVGAFLIDEIILADSRNNIISSLSNAPDQVDEQEVLRLVGSLERGCNHPLAAALVGRAAARGVKCDAEVHGSSIVPGFGIMGIVDGRAVRAGTSAFIKQNFYGDHHHHHHGDKKQCSNGQSNNNNSSEIAQLDQDAARFEGGGVTTCFIAIDDHYAACITARDSLRPEAAEAVASLCALGVVPAMLTGDNTSVAKAIGTAAGLEERHIHAALLPQDKLDLVSAYNVDLFQTYDYLNQGVSSSGFSKKLNKMYYKTVGVMCFWKKLKIFGGDKPQKKRKIRVAHVGDGVNDAPALAAADVGIAMGVAGAAAALEAGDVCLFTNDLRVVPALQRLARAAGNKIAFNIALSVVTKVIVLILAALGKFTLFGAVLVDVGTALLVTLNGLTLLRWDFGLGASPAGCVGAAAAAAASVSADGHGCCSNKGCCAPSKGPLEFCSLGLGKEMNSSSTNCCGGAVAATSTVCKSKGCCGGGDTATANGTLNKGIDLNGKACCDQGAEEAQQGCCHHAGHHHDHSNGNGHHHHHNHENTTQHSHDHKEHNTTTPSVAVNIHPQHSSHAPHISHSHSNNGGGGGGGGGGCCGHDHEHNHHQHEHTPSPTLSPTPSPSNALLKTCSKSCCSSHTHH